MKQSIAIFGLMLLTGCAVNPPPRASTENAGPAREYESATASALAFDAPVAAAYPLLGLDRAAREPGAFIGYEDVTTEVFTIGFIDNQTSDACTDYYNRYSFSEKSGSRTR